MGAGEDIPHAIGFCSLCAFFLVFMHFIPFSFMLGIENYALIYAFLVDYARLIRAFRVLSEAVFGFQDFW